MSDVDALDEMLDAPSRGRPHLIEAQYPHLIPLIARFVWRTSERCPNRSMRSASQFYEWLKKEHDVEFARTTLLGYIRTNRERLENDGKPKEDQAPSASRKRRRPRSRA